MKISSDVLKLAVEHDVYLYLRRQSDGVDLEIREVDGKMATMVGLDGLAVRGEIHTTTCDCDNKQFIMQPDELDKVRALISFANVVHDIDILEPIAGIMHHGKEVTQGDWVISKRSQTGRCLGATDVFYVIKVFEPVNGLLSFVGATVTANGGIETSVQESWRYRRVNPHLIKDFQTYLDVFKHVETGRWQ